MSRDGSVVLEWGPGTYNFSLKWGELEMLQEAVDMGPWLILQRLSTQQCNVGEIAEVLRCGLIGGGATPVEAVKLVDTYVKKRPPAENLLHAQAILAVALYGAPEEGVGEEDAASEKTETI